MYYGKKILLCFAVLVLVSGNPAINCFAADATPAPKDSKTADLNLDLLKAVADGNLDATKKAVSDGADVNAMDGQHGMTALVWAVGKGHAEVVAFLLEKGANPNAAIPNGPPALQIAIDQNKPEIAQMLEKAGAVFAAQQEGPSPEGLLFAAVSEGNEPLVKELLENGVNPNIANDNGITPLALAAFQGNANMVADLLAKGAEIDYKNNEGWTALTMACEKGHLAVCEVLLEKGANINLNTEGGWSPLSLAKTHKHKELVKFLKSKGGKEGEPRKVSSGYRQSDDDLSLDVDMPVGSSGDMSSRRGGSWKR